MYLSGSDKKIKNLELISIDAVIAMVECCN